MISKRARSVDASGIRRVFDLAAKLKDPVNLSIGQPDFDAFEEVREGAHRAIEERRNSYTQTQGIAELREALAAKYGVASDPSKTVFLTSGVSGGLMLSYLVTLDPGDEIMIPDPYFVMYRDLTFMVSGVPRFYDTYPDFKITRESLERAYSPRVKAMVVCSPSNPTGHAIDQTELDAVVAFAKEKDIWLIYDEIYEQFSYGQSHLRPLAIYPKTILLNGFSKSHGITGWRVGFAIAPTEVGQEMLKLQQYTYVCAPSMAQWGVLAGLNVDFTEILKSYRAKRDFMYEALKDRFNIVKPEGAFYLFPEAPGGSGQKFVERCIEQGLLVVPGNVFSQRDTHFRISFAASERNLERGAEILNRLA